MKYIVIQLDDGGDLNRYVFDAEDQARSHLERYEYKAWQERKPCD